MRRGWFFAAMLVALALPARGAEYFQQFHHTTMHVTLDTERKWITGTQSILYVNNSPDTLREFYLHLYPSAFRDKNTAYMKDRNRGYNVVLRDVPEKNKGWIDLANMKIDGTPVDVTVDDTIAKMALPAALLPGDTMRVEFDWNGKVRAGMDRAGYQGDHYDFAQWYPKLVVYDESGFHPDKFRTGEFYGEFGTFDVHIELPEHFVVAATGVVAGGDPGWDYNPPGQKNAPKREKTGKTKTVHFHAEHVHDFAWCADPSFVVEDSTFKDTKVYSVYRRGSASTWEDSTLAHAMRAMAWLDKRVGKYPYPQITVCEALRSGGMEYPMFVMDGRASEGLAFHEIGHVYFYGILANNEREEAWIDEGFTSFQTRWYQTVRYGPWGDTSKWNFYQRMTPQYRLWEDYRRNVFDLNRRGYGERVSFRAEDYEHNYRANVYDKAALVFNVLRFVAGDSTFDAVNRTFFDRWQLKHVNEARYRAVWEEVAQRDLSRQFEQWLHTVKTVDYELVSVRTRADSSGVRTQIEVRRLGELYCPIEAQFTMPDGSVVRERMDAKDRVMTRVVRLPAEPVSVAINADNEIMDVNLSNNFQPRKRDFQFDWPNNAYHPEDAYQIRHRPAIWYNDVDGAKVGYHLFGSLQGWKHRARLGLYYGAESGQLDFSASLEEPFHMFGSNGTLDFSGYRMEGRNDATIEVRLARRPRLLYPPTHFVTLGFNYHELRDPAYLVSPEIYDTLTADTGPYFGYAVEPQFDVAAMRFDAQVKLGREFLGGDVKYDRFATSLTLHSRPEATVGMDARVRLFGGFSGGGTPMQRKFNLAGGGAMKAEERFWLRAPGAVPDGLHYLEPGDGNLRGYQAGTFAVNKLFAMNVELGRGLKLPGVLGKAGKVLGSMALYGFWDAGWILDSSNPIATSARVSSLVDGGVLDARLENAGVGIRSNTAWPFWNFTWRFDVPFYVSHPDVNGESDTVDWRYVFSLNATF